MNITAKKLVPIFLAAVMLASCSSFLSTPTTSQADIMQTTMSTVSTAFAETQGAIPTAIPSLLPPPTVSFLTSTPFPVPTLLPSSTPLVFTDPSIPLSERIIYYRGVAPGENPIPAGSVLAAHLFAPTYTNETYTTDTAADLRTALKFILGDRNGIWASSDIDVAVRNAHADVVLQGEYHVAGGGQLWAASWQILMTVFANPSVLTATVTFNGRTISNLGISRSEDAKSDDYVYTRAEIEVFINENAYESP